MKTLSTSKLSCINKLVKNVELFDISNAKKNELKQCFIANYIRCAIWDSFNQAAIDYWIRKSNKDKIRII